jgi:hypothetical protein
VRSFVAEFPILPAYSDGRVIYGFQRTGTTTQYMRVEAASGQAVRLSEAASPAEYGSYASDAVIWGVQREFESTKPQVLRAWPVDSYGAPLAIVQADAISTPIVDDTEGRLFFAVGTGATEIRSLDRRGQTSTILQVPYPMAPRGVSSDGATLVIERATTRPRYALVDLRGAPGTGSATIVDLHIDAPAWTVVGIVR